jgi:NAD+ synthetase
MITSSHELNRIRENVVDYTVGYLVEYPNIKSLVLGVSGGADSAAVGLLAQEVCERCKTQLDRDIKLIGRSLIIEVNTQEEIDRAEKLGKLFCNDFRTMDLTSTYYGLINNIELPMEEALTHTYADKIRLGNIKARLRMIQLYHLAHVNQGLVLSTDNLTEYKLGFWTIHGDVGDYGMIQNLWKTEVYGILKQYYNFSPVNSDKRRTIRSVIEAVPTDGLGITDSDLDQFGDVESYEEVDKILEEYSNGKFPDIVKRGGQISQVLTMYENTHYKRENPYSISRKNLLESVHGINPRFPNKIDFIDGGADRR